MGGSGFHRSWRDWTSAEWASAPVSEMLAVLPVAAIEQHGPHLPVDTDSAIVEAVIAGAVARLTEADCSVFLPMQAIGRSEEHLAFPGTLSVPAALLADHWTAILRTAARTGIRRFLVFNGHGGQPAVMDIVARRLRVEDGLLVARASWFDLVDLDDLFAAPERDHGIHGGAIETALMLAIAPERVRMDAIADFPSRAARWASGHRFLAPDGRAAFGWMTQDLGDSGALGNATAATAETGRLILDRAITGLVTLLGEIARFRPPWFD